MEPTIRPHEVRPFLSNAGLLEPGLRAPLPLEANTRAALNSALRAAFQRAGALPEIIEPAATTGGGLVHALEGLVLNANRLIAAERKDAAEAVRGLLWASRDLLGARDSAYVLKQVAETLAGGAEEAPAGDFERVKGLMEPLERRLEELGLPARMDPVRFAVLQVRLDEAYDDAGRQLQRFYRAIAGGEPAALSGFARGLARAVMKEIVPDHVLASDAGPGRERTGLIDLLPELEREFL